MKYNKPPLSPDKHVELLLSRGLNIADVDRAKKYLRNIGYFRLSGYMYHLQSNDGFHRFKSDTNFDDIILHYRFDKELRAIIIEYLERVEVALRARLTDNYSIKYGFYWYTKRNLYDDNEVYQNINDEIAEKFRNPQERFLKSFKSKYYQESLPPFNMAMEILSFGKLSRLYKGLKNMQEKNEIAIDFGLPSTILSSWLVYLTTVRNICAHHSRLWNRRITANRPTIPTRRKYKFNGCIPDDFNTTMYGIVSMIDRLLKGINPSNSFISKFTALLQNFSDINTKQMDFPDGWANNPAWKDSVSNE